MMKGGTVYSLAKAGLFFMHKKQTRRKKPDGRNKHSGNI